MTALEFGFDCSVCGVEGGTHRYDGDELVCRECGASRRPEPELVAVVEVRHCPWCRATLPVGHDCPAGAVGCLSRGATEPPCGACECCLTAQATDLALRADLIRYGSPSDADTPWETS